MSFRTAAVAVATVFSAASAPAAPLQPVGKWVVDFGETQCVAARDFGNAGNPTSLAIRPAPNGKTFELLVVERRPTAQYADEHKGWVDFGTGPITAWMLRYHTKDKRALYLYRISATEMAQARSAAQVQVHSDKSGTHTFALASMPALLDALDQCTTDLRKYWNEDGVDIGQVATSAHGDLRQIFSSDDFPSEALTRGQEGTTQFLLLIDATGKVANCHMVKTSGIPVLDAMGCQVIQERAKFTPALDAKGKGVRSMVVTPEVVWRLAG